MLPASHRFHSTSEKQPLLELVYPSVFSSYYRTPGLGHAASTEPNCQHSSTTISPVKEVDTELLQTDTRILYEELPDLADDSNSTLGDIHNFLTEHPTIPTKKCSKSKKKKDGPTINAVKVPTAADSITQRLDELAEQLKELKVARSRTSLRLNKRRPTTPKSPLSPAKRRSKICYYHRTYGDKAKKCQPGCNYLSTDSTFSDLNSTGPERNITSRSAEKCFVQLTNLTLRPDSNHFSNICTPFSSIHTIKRQAWDMAESTEPNYQQPAAIASPVKEVDTKLLQTDTQEFYEEISRSR
nr:hypothetical transcript [Hymenolepis microstoma]